MAFGTEDQFWRPCVDCGLATGSFCDYCRAADRLPDELWVHNQMTPLCSHCDNKYGACHFCRGQLWCVPPSHTHAKSTLDAMPDDNRGGCKIAGTRDNYDKVSKQVNKDIKYLPQKTEMLRSSKGKGYSSTAITMPLSEREAAPTVSATRQRSFQRCCFWCPRQCCPPARAST